MSISFSLVKEVPPDVEVLGVPVFAGGREGPGAELDEAFLAERAFEGKLGETLAIPSDDGGTILAVGMGDPTELDADRLRRAAAALVRAAWNARSLSTTLLHAAPADLDAGRAAQAIAEGMVLAGYRFTRYKGEQKPCKLEQVSVVGGGGARVQAALDRGAHVGAAVNMARDLVNTPAGDKTPTQFAEFATEVAAQSGLGVEVLDEVDIEGERLGGLLGVSAGSDEPARLVKLTYDPPGARYSLALVGKGITFDSGGLSLKPADSMESMKTDMSGAAAVLGAMSVLAGVKAKVRVIGLIPLSENMPSGKAIKPGDVLKIRNGKTVEVLNTDAEGRLILADALSLAAESGVEAIVDLATLTGACMVALGTKYAGLMGTSDAWIRQVQEAAERAGERVWHLPLPAEYRKLIDSEVADIKNTAGRHGGALTAGLFLREFVGDVPWVHLDIAGPARADSDDGYVPKGGTGYGVRTLVEAVLGFKKP